jgi:hypothetical protein
MLYETDMGGEFAGQEFEELAANLLSSLEKRTPDAHVDAIEGARIPLTLKKTGRTSSCWSLMSCRNEEI